MNTFVLPQSVVREGARILTDHYGAPSLRFDALAAWYARYIDSPEKWRWVLRAYAYHQTIADQKRVTEVFPSVQDRNYLEQLSRDLPIMVVPGDHVVETVNMSADVFVRFGNIARIYLIDGFNQLVRTKSVGPLEMHIYVQWNSRGLDHAFSRASLERIMMNTQLRTETRWRALSSMAMQSHTKFEYYVSNEALLHWCTVIGVGRVGYVAQLTYTAPRDVNAFLIACSHLTEEDFGSVYRADTDAIERHLRDIMTTYGQNCMFLDGIAGGIAAVVSVLESAGTCPTMTQIILSAIGEFVERSVGVDRCNSAILLAFDGTQRTLLQAEWGMLMKMQKFLRTV